MENKNEVISLVKNITSTIDYPLALVDVGFNVLWLNDQAVDRFGKTSCPTELSQCVEGFNSVQTLEKIRHGQSCVFKAKDNCAENVFLMGLPYDDGCTMAAIWSDEHDDLLNRYEQTKIDTMIMQHIGRTAVNSLFLSVAKLERDPKIEDDEELSQTLLSIERDAYKMYVLLNDLELFYKQHANFPTEMMNKINVTEYIDGFMAPAQMTLQTIGALLKYENKVKGDRYTIVNPDSLATAVLKLIKAVILFARNEKKVRVTLTENGDSLHLKIVGKENRLFEYIVEDAHKKEFMEHASDVTNVTNAFSYTTAKMMIERNNMSLDVTNTDKNTISINVTIPVTADPTGALKSERAAYLGNRFSVINIIFGEMLK